MPSVKSNNTAEHYLAILDQSIDAVIYTDDRGKVVFCNLPFETLSNISAETILGRYIWEVHELLSPETGESNDHFADLRQGLLAFLEKGAASWEPEVVRLQYRHPDGRNLCFESHIFAVRTAGGSSIASVIRDVTGRKVAEAALQESQEKFRSVVEQANEGILVLDEAGSIVEWNASLEAFSGVSRQSVLGHAVGELPQILSDQVPEGDVARSRAVRQTITDLAEEARLNPTSVVEGKFLHPDGDERHLLLQLFPIQVASGRMTGCMIRDITQQKKNEQNLRRYTFQLETLRQIGLELSGELSIESLAWMIAPRAIELLSASAMALYLHDPVTDVLELAICLGDSQPPIERAVRRGQGLAGQVWERGEPILLEDYHTGHTGQLILEKPVWGKVAGSPIVYAGEFMGVLFVFSNRAFATSDLKLLGLFASHAGAAIRNARMHAQLHELAIRDPMTGIFNRRHFFELADSIFDQARRYNRPISAVVFDADHYKNVNDTYGHLVGDEVLKQIAARCSAVIRQADIFGRYGGEEFVIVMPETGLAGALKMAERLRQAVGELPFETEKGQVPVTISLGVARSRRSTATLLELLGDADEALYRAKDAGRNRVHD